MTPSSMWYPWSRFPVRRSRVASSECHWYRSSAFACLPICFFSTSFVGCAASCARGRRTCPSARTSSTRWTWRRGIRWCLGSSYLWTQKNNSMMLNSIIIIIIVYQRSRRRRRACRPPPPLRRWPWGWSWSDPGSRIRSPRRRSPWSWANANRPIRRPRRCGRWRRQCRIHVWPCSSAWPRSTSPSPDRRLPRSWGSSKHHSRRSRTPGSSMRSLQPGNDLKKTFRAMNFIKNWTNT